MTEQVSTAPYFIQISEPPQRIFVPEVDRFELPASQEVTSLNTISNGKIILNSVEIVEQGSDNFNENLETVQEHPCIVQIVYPHDLKLTTIQNTVKRGRPKKQKKDQREQPVNDKIEKKIAKTARTRSGRLVKLPKYIEDDFKKIEITEEQEVQVSDFKRTEEKENSKIEFGKLETKKRVIPSQYKCPKCFKAYLGKNKMIQHLKKYPDHGPLPEGFQQFNFDVWNYLFDITQKCKSGQKGVKFCEELSNLLHNVQLLKNALFKTVTDNKNSVQIDKVLGNAIGLPPGKYKFDENELYKDVTVLKLITNSDFFKPNVNTKVNDNSQSIKSEQMEDLDTEEVKIKKIKPNDDSENSSKTELSIIDAEKRIDIYQFDSKSDQININAKCQDNTNDSFSKKIEVDNQVLSSDILNDNLLLQSLPNSRHSVEELMLTGVDNSSNLLDNSTSSDEVMNVDQFVNERFKKIIEPDIELGNTSLNLDLPSLELFQFHTS